jgi:hypothetical protein
MSWARAATKIQAMPPRGRLLRALRFKVKNFRIAEIEVIANPAHLRQLDLAVLAD